MPDRRIIVAGMAYTIDEDVELDEPDRNPNPPPSRNCKGNQWDGQKKGKGRVDLPH